MNQFRLVPETGQVANSVQRSDSHLSERRLNCLTDDFAEDLKVFL